MNHRRKHLMQLSAVLLSFALAAGCSNDPVNGGANAGSAANTADTSAPVSSGAQTGANAGSLELPAGADYKADDLNTAWERGTSTMIALSGSTASIEGSGAAVSDGVVTINAAGTYVLSGKLDGRLVIDTTKNDKVHLVLNGAEIISGDGAAVDVKEAELLVVTLQEGTRSIITDGLKNTAADASEDAPNAAFYSKADTTVNGTGTLVVNGRYRDGLTSRDDLKIVSGTIEVHAADDGILGRERVAIRGGSVTVEAGGDGIKSSKDDEEGKGNVLIEGGTIDVTAGGDGVQAAVSLRIDDGTVSIIAGGGSANGELRVEERPGRPGRPGEAAPDAETPAAASASEIESPSRKGLKVARLLVMLGGTATVDAADDAVHADGSVIITGGALHLKSGDDGIHAEDSVTIEGGVIDIAESYEGIEGRVVTVLDGELRIVASDDGINTAGGKQDESGPDGREDPFAVEEGVRLSIHGGDIVVVASGDGLDSNGLIEMTGGRVIVNSQSAGPEGAIDYNGKFQMSGGLLAAAGGAQMAQGPSPESTQPAIVMSFPERQPAGTEVRIEDDAGNTVAAMTPTVPFELIVISAPELKQGAAYRLVASDEVVTSFDMTDTVTWLNESGVTEAGTGFGGRPGAPGGQGWPPGGMGEGVGGMRPGRGERPMPPDLPQQQQP